MINSSKLILILISLVFFFFIYKGYENNVASLHFVDEEENIVIAKYMLQGEKLYSQLFAQHQPLTYILSAEIQQVTKPNSIYLLIKKHRDFMIIWSVVWSVLLISKLGLPALIFSIVYETSKIFLLGNVFLAESLVVYPLVFLSAIVLAGGKLKSWKFVGIGLISSTIFFLLSPVWPLLLVLVFILLGNQRGRYIKNMALIFMGTLPIILVIFHYSSARDYFYLTMFINYRYYIPVISNDSFLMGTIKSLLTPLLSFVPQPESLPTLWIIRTLSTVLLINLAILLKLGKYKQVLVFLTILGLANLRFVQPGFEYYRGFHLLPWYGLLILVVSLSSWYVYLTHAGYGLRDLKKLFVILSLSLLIILSINFSQNTLFKKRVVANDLYINYSRQFDIGNAISIMKSRDDSLFLAPDEFLVYWQADIKHVSPMVFYYAWMNGVDLLRSQIDSMFEKNPPTFLYISRAGTGLEKYFGHYQRMIKDHRQTGLFVLPKRLSNLSSKQKEQLKFFGFEI